ncbi:DUF1963 domain-containing protein [Agrobacterium rosae]|uniref:DUF1963 domain-containing protein n=1 Tax=Agrobacterium rosae TaxID=1972867 RepID=UPI0019D36115|nr:DUF1963 domain-containing protein [Agrobacterium rosae]MBN7809023.1 DUF1963 domain-containing protein [Agrobacterium rosae]
MTYRLQRWMTQDFVFTAPRPFFHVVAVEPQRFILQPSPGDEKSPSLSVLVRDQGQPWSLDERFSFIAADLFGAESSADWQLAPIQLFGREGRTATGIILSAAANEEIAGLTLVNGRSNRLWAFGWRSSAHHRDRTEKGFEVLMQGLQARVDETGEKILLSQFHQQEKKRHSASTVINAPGAPVEHGVASREWDERFALALGETEASRVAQFFAEAIALEEQPYGEPMPLGASRIGGGPDLVPGTWPDDARGMRHPFLMQVDLAEVKAACSTTGPLPDEGLLSFFVHDDALLVDVVYTPAGSSLVRHDMTEAIIEASSAAVQIVAELDPDTPIGMLPHTEGDLVTAELMADGSLQFAHTSDPVWSVGQPGCRFEALSDERWATAASALLLPRATRTFDLLAAETHLEETGLGSIDDLVEAYEDFELAEAGRQAGEGQPQVHQMLGYATIRGGHDCRVEAAEDALSRGWGDLGEPMAWVILVRLPAGSATGRIFWDADDLVIMVPVADLATNRFDRCVLLSG